MIDCKKYINIITDYFSVSGFEHRTSDKLIELFRPYFTDVKKTKTGSVLFIKSCGKPDAPKLLLDAHYDEIGFMIKKIDDNGFCSVVSIGGVDSGIMHASEVVIHGNEEVYGVFDILPCQLSDEENKRPAISDLIIDTGFTKSELEKKGVRIGTPVGYKNYHVDLLNDSFASKSLDDKCCLVANIAAAEMCNNTDFDIYVLASTKEEVGGAGAVTGAFEFFPDAAIAVDVGFATVPDTDKHSTSPLDGGPVISISACTDRKLTQAIIETAKEKELPYKTSIEPIYTGTNGDDFPEIKCGIPTAVVSIPIKNMHTFSEIVSVKGIEDCAELISAFATEGFLKWIKK